MIDTTHLFVLALLVYMFGLGSQRFARSVITAPMAFVAFGLLLAPDVCSALGIGHLFKEIEHLDPIIHLLGEITLVVVLFTDAAQIRLNALIRGAVIPARLLGIGMPLTILLGALIGSFFFEELGVWELALLATMLAPTDAALGQALVTSEQVPLRIRQGLSVESGLNDGIAVPLVVIFASLASIGQSEPQAMGHESQTVVLSAASCVAFAAKQIVYGPLVGVAVGMIGAWLMTRAIRHELMQHAYRELSGITLAIIAFVVAGSIGGNGFIAAFCAGIAMGNSSREVRENLYDFAEAESQLLMLTTFFLVGVGLAWEPIRHASWEAWVYALLSLTLIRMLPVVISLIGMNLHQSTPLFLGWFGPRGLASVLFAVLVVDELPVPNSGLINQIVIITVLLSVFAHGVSAAPMSRVYARTLGRKADDEIAEKQNCPLDPISKRTLERPN